MKVRLPWGVASVVRWLSTKIHPGVWLVAFLVLAVDYATKYWAIEKLSDGHEINLIGSHLTLKLVYNEGAALSILGEYGIAISVFMIVVIAVLLWYHGRAAGPYSIIVFGAALGGAFGNLFDRMVRGEGWGRGPVVDMINYGDFFIGNVADIAIVCAAAATIAASWMKVPMLRTPGMDSEGEMEGEPLGE